MGWMTGWLIAGAISLLASAAQADDEQAVDVELVLAVDVSLSMTREELEIQRAGYASALTNPSVIAAMLGGYHGQIAITFMEWSGAGQQKIVVPWQLISSPQDAELVAALLHAERQPGWRRTSISGALQFAARQFEGNGFNSEKQIIDISGDGPNNSGIPVAFARDAVLRQGIVINGLPLMTGPDFMSVIQLDDLDHYYQECVIGGPGSFVMPVVSWQEFAETVRRKLVLELSGTMPRPRLIHASSSMYDCMIGEKLWQQRRGLFGP